MNREFKFRAWHIEEKLLCQIETLTSEGAFLLGIKKGEDQISDRMIVYAPDNGRFCKSAEIELMQYTGLKDKNGKQIYEGDILKNVHGNYAVEFSEIDAQFQLLNFDQYGMAGEFPSFWESENIGNMYENPELLLK